MPTDPRIQITDLRKVYGTGERAVVALDGVDLSVRPGEIHGVVGRSGAGKSTLIRCLTLLERPTSGAVVVDGVDLGTLPEARLRTARRAIGLVFQHVNLLDSRTVAANVAHPLQIAGVRRRERDRRARELLDLVGLADRGDAYPAELSGGQRQRVGIARALATEPAVLLCDEPTSALDAETTRQILTLVRDLRDRLGICVVVITHEMSVVRQVCDTVTLLEHGRVVQHGAVGDVAAEPGTRLARELIPLPEPPVGAHRALLEVSYRTDRVPGDQVLGALAGLGPEVQVAAGTIEQIAGRGLGRLHLDVPAERVDAVVHRLRADGLHVADQVRSPDRPHGDRGGHNERVDRGERGEPAPTQTGPTPGPGATGPVTTDQAAAEQPRHRPVSAGTTTRTGPTR